MRFSPRTLGLLAAVVTVTLWTGFIVIARAAALRTLTPLDIALLRISGASLVLLPWGWWMVRRRRALLGAQAPASSLLGISPLPLGTTALLGTFGGLLYAVLAYSGFFHAPATHASVLMPGSLPLWTALLAALLLRDPITPLRAAGLALIVAGDLLVGGLSLLAAFSGGEVWKGDVLFMLAAACWATYTVQARRHAVDAVQATIAITAFACMVYLPAYAALVALGAVTSHLAQAPWGEIIFHMVFQGCGSVVISGITFTRMIQHYGPVRSTMITALVPGLSAIGAVIFLGEPLHWNLVGGLLLVTGGILLGVLRGPSRPAPANAAAAAATARGRAAP